MAPKANSQQPDGGFNCAVSLTGVTHSPSRRSRNAGDEADDGLVGGVVGPQKVGRVFFRATTNLSNHDDSIRLAVLQKDLQAVYEVGSREGITADANHERLTEASLGGLIDGFVGEGTRTRDDADAATLVDEARHDANLALARCDDARAVGTDHPSFALSLEYVCDADHVVLGDAFCDADDERYLGLNGFLDAFCGEWWRDEDGGCIGSCLLHGIADAREYGLAQMLLSGLLRICAADDVRSVLEGLLCVKAVPRSACGSYPPEIIIVLTYVPCLPVKP